MHFLYCKSSPQTAFWMTILVKFSAYFWVTGLTTTHHKQRETSVFCFPGCFRAGDRILLADDSNEDWWKVGTIRKPNDRKNSLQQLSQFEWNPHVNSFYVLCFFSQGVIEDRIGFFPAAFAHLVHAGDRVFRCNRTFIGCKEQGQITLKEGQVLGEAISSSAQANTHRSNIILAHQTRPEGGSRSYYPLFHLHATPLICSSSICRKIYP